MVQAYLKKRKKEKIFVKANQHYKLGIFNRGK